MIPVALISLAIVCVCLSALVFRMHTTTVRALERSHERTLAYNEGLVNRIMSRDYQEYQAYEVDTPMEIVEEAIEPELVPVDGPDRGGFGSRLGLRALTDRRALDEEASNLTASEELLSADLP